MKVDGILSNFTNDEIVFVNRMISGENLNTFSLEKMKKAIGFQKMMAVGAEDEVKELISGTFEKISAISENEWEELKKLSPFPCLDENVDIE